ncbi:MAG: hypothetical protein ACOC41_05620 [Chitinivibrionales bacterium]
MNNIHEEDWAAESWGGHTGMGNDSEYSTVEDETQERDTKKDEE